MQPSHTLSKLQIHFTTKTSTKTRQHEKKSRASALLEKLCRPYFPANLDLIFIWRGDAACARQGSSRDLDHQTWPCGLPAAILVDQNFDLVIIFGNECSKFEQFTK
jgi:hypothetical protein